jgi:hypothetical protein
MNAATKQRYSFGHAQNWMDDEPAAPAPAPLADDREEFKRKTQEAAASVGYVAPSEQAAIAASPEAKAMPAPGSARSPKAAKPKPAPIPEPDLKKGRPKGDRTIQMSVRIRQEHDELIKAIARDDFSVASIVEAALVAFAKGIYEDKRYKRMPLDTETLELARSVFTQHRN